MWYLYQLRLDFNPSTSKTNREVSNNENRWRSSLEKPLRESPLNTSTFKKLHWTNCWWTRSKETTIIERNWGSVRKSIHNGSFKIRAHYQGKQMRMTEEIYRGWKYSVWSEWRKGETVKFYWFIVVKFEQRMIFRLLSLKAK